MIISIVFFLSLFSYFKFIDDTNNPISRIKTPFIFFICLFSIWEILTLLLSGSGINYQILSFFYEISFSLLTILFFIIYSRNIYLILKNKDEWKKIFDHLLFFLTLLFFMIFLLFYHKTQYPEESDQIGDFYIMKYLSQSSTYIIPSNLNNYPALYYDVGFYQLGASLNISQRLMLDPYFTMFLYFYITSNTLYFVFNKYIKSKLKINLYYICCISLFLILYLYFNTYTTYVVMVGNIDSSYLLSLVIIPSITNKQKIMHIEIYIAFFSYLFLNETSILVCWVYILSYIVTMTLVRKKFKFSFLSLINYCLLFVLSLYLIFNDFLLIKNYDYNMVYFSLKFIPYLFIILSLLAIIFTFVSWYLKKYKMNLLLENNALNFMSKLWYHNEFLQFDSFVLRKIEWFSNKNVLIFLKIFALSIFIMLMYFGTYGSYAFNLSEFYKSNGSNSWYIFLITITVIAYSLLGYALIFKWRKFNIFLFFYSLLIITSFTAAWILNYEETERLFYVTLFPAFGMASFIHNAIIFTFLFISSRIKYYFKKYKKNTKSIFWKIKNNLISYSLVSVTAPMVLVPTILNICNNTLFNKLKLEPIYKNAYGGFELDTIYKLEKFNFNNELTFSDIPIPIFNSSAEFNINHKAYGLYYSSNYVLEHLQALKIFKNIKGDYINFLDFNTLENNILPYYSFIVLRNSDSLFNKVIDSMKQFKLVDVINDQINIYINTNLNKTLQEKFLHYNNDTF